MGALIHVRTDRVLAPNALIASHFWTQFRGLMGRAGGKYGVALGLPNCRQVHTALVRVSLDVVFCDREGCALIVVANLAPWRISPQAPASAAMAWEAHAGSLAPFVVVGDVLRYEDDARR